MKPENSLKLLGTLIIEKGWLTQDQIDDALGEQVDSLKKLGEILLKSNLLKPEQLDELLKIHEQKSFRQDEIHFGQLAVRNKFVSAEDVDFALKQQKKSKKLLGEILVANGLMTLQKSNAIFKIQKRLLLKEEVESSDAFISCPECKSAYKIKDPDRPRELRCHKCGMIFELAVDSRTIVKDDNSLKSDSDALTIQSQETVAPKKSVQDDFGVETVVSKPSNISQDEADTILSAPKSDFNSLKTFLKDNALNQPVQIGSGSSFGVSGEGRYDIGKEIARGGMGAILATKDLNIRRNIVTKVLLNKKSKGLVLRFIREAQINGQLEHPNIVPVHDLGMNKKGQIYFTMKWVNGHTLKEIIQKLKEGDEEYRAKYSLPALLEIIQKVSEALAYSHHKSVIHRDLKPENIMVGEFGEVQLMDWGLAKVLGQDESKLEELDEKVTIDSKADLVKTVVGSAVGTPQYMSPEQAKGDVKAMDTRTDIYGLGGVLYACISLKAPITGNSMKHILSKVTKGRVDPLSSDVAPELIAIVNKAMALKSIDRYQDIKEMSADVTAFQNGYAVSAKQDSFLEALAKLIKRNKALSLGASVALLALTIGFGVSLWQWGEAVKSEEKAIANKKEAIAQKNLAEKNAALAIENERKIHLEKAIGRKKLTAQKQAQLDRKRALSQESVNKGQAYLNKAKLIDHKVNQKSATAKSRELFSASNAFRQALIQNNENEKASSGLYESSKIHFELSLYLKAFEQADAILSDLNISGAELKELIDFKNDLKISREEKRKSIKATVEHLMADAKKLKREILLEAGSKELISLRDKITVELLRHYIKSNIENCQELAIESLAWMNDPAVAIDILPYIQKKKPDGTKNSEKIQVAALLAISILKPKDRKIYEQVRERIWKESENLSSLLFHKVKRFYANYAKMMATESEISLGKSNIAAKWHVQGLKYVESEEYEKAISSFTKAIDLNQMYTSAYISRGISKFELGNIKEAIADYNKALELNPEDAITYNNRGNAKKFLRDFSGALEDYNKSIEHDPKYANVYISRGNVKNIIKDFTGALSDFNKSIELNPNEASAYNGRGNGKQAQGDFSGALSDYNKSIELLPNDPMTYTNRGIIKKIQGDFSGALSDFNKSIEMNPKNAQAYHYRGSVIEIQGDIPRAIVEYTKAIELNPKLWRIWGSRGKAKNALADYSGAITDFNKTIELNPKDTKTYNLRGIAKSYLGNYSGAITDYNKSIELNPRDPTAINNRGLAKTKQGDVAGAIADFNKSLELDPKNALTYINLGFEKKGLGDFLGALADYNKGLELNPKMWGAWGYKAVVVYGLKKDQLFLEALAKMKHLNPSRDVKEWIIKEGEKIRRQVEGAKLVNKNLVTASEYNKRGEYFIFKKKLKEAQADFTKAVELDASFGPKGAFQGLIDIADLNKDFLKKLQIFQEWAAAKPNDANIHNNYASELLLSPDKKIQDIVLALKIALKASELSEFLKPGILDTLAMANFKNGKLKKAIEYGEKALRLLPAYTPAKQKKVYTEHLAKYKTALKSSKKND